MASGAADDNDAAPAKTGADTSASSVKRDDEPVPSPWRDVPSAADACMPVLGVAELWPELSRSVAAAKGKKAPAHSSSTAAVAPTPKAALNEQLPGTTSKQIRGDHTSRHDDHAIPAASVEPPPTNAPNNTERRAAAPEQPPMHASSHRSSTAGVRGHHHRSGRFVPHLHGQSGEGFNGGGSRRPAGGANGRGNANANRSTTYRNRGGGRHGQEHGGGFNRQPRGRGHEDGHMPLGPPAGYVEAPHHMHPPPLPPPFMPMVMPPYPYYHGPPVGYGPYGYGYPEFVTGYLPFIPEALPPFMQYTAPLNHMMHTNLEQQAGPSQTDQPPQQQHAPQQQPMQAQRAPPDQIQQQNPEQMRQEIRQQIEYYFSAKNLENDTFLKERMDEQGWVPLTLIAGFKKVFSKTTDMEFILDSILPSTEVEVLVSFLPKRF
ncbi:la-related protein 1C [Panicum miliaceum]|uniref:La-related protein 1C n=1 Tax=Panicum miliaceum TaxID=4540 RepID=A0A3L6TEH2_PANMI|nr:la-related protein 1C [Panicum miliaceum]